jgi:hypothetical protein
VMKIRVYRVNPTTEERKELSACSVPVDDKARDRMVISDAWPLCQLLSVSAGEGDAVNAGRTAAVGTRRGFWAECITHTADVGTCLVASVDTVTALQAVEWVRGSAGPLVSLLDEGERDAALSWLEGGGCIGTVAGLRRGKACTFTVRRGGTLVEWTVRPVVFLPLAGRDDRGVPACAGRFACAVPDSDHHCGSGHG